MTIYFLSIVAKCVPTKVTYRVKKNIYILEIEKQTIQTFSIYFLFKIANSLKPHKVQT